MDFRAALIRNVKPFVPANSLVIPPAVHKLATQQDSNSEHLAQKGKQNTTGELKTKRRRRRRNNTAKQHDNTEHQTNQFSVTLGDLEEKEPDGLPSFRLLQASPTVEVSDDQGGGNIEFLRTVAERARERLASRIQTYLEGKQQVIEAASKIQQAYSTHIECQLQAITDAMKAHLSQEVDAKFDAYDDQRHQKLDASLAGIRVEISRCHKQDEDSLRNHQDRITALEMRVQAMMESLNGHRLTVEETRPAIELDLASEIQQRISQLYSSFYELRRQHQETTNLVREMQTFMSSLGLMLPTKSPRDVASIDEINSSHRGILPETKGLRKTQQERTFRPALCVSSNSNLNKENNPPLSLVGNRSTSPLSIHRVMMEDLL